MKKYLNSVVAKFDTTQSGNAATGTTITVRDSSTGLRASLFSDNGVTALSNPFTVDSNGNYEFYVADGRYNIIQDENLPTQLTLADVSIFDVSVSFGAPKTVTALTNNIFNFGVGSSLTVSGYVAEGDGGFGVWVKTTDTDTAGQLPTVRQDGTLTDQRGSVWRIAVSGTLDPRAVGFTGTGDNTAALTAAFGAVGIGGKIALDKSYNFELNNLYSQIPAEIDFANSTVTSNTTREGIRIDGAFTSVVDVTSVSGKTLNVTSTAGFVIGDVVKVTSSDEQADVWVLTRFIGQFAIILDIVGNVVTLDRNIIDDNLYQTDIKMYKLEKRTAVVKNLTIGPSLALANHTALVSFESLYEPRMENVNTINSRNSNMRFISCFGYTCIDCSSENSLDQISTNNFGYGTEDTSSDGGYIENFRFHKGRHAFTNNGSSVGVPDPRCGYSTNITIVNSEAYEAESGAWDTHPGAINVQFIDCKAYNCAFFGQSRTRVVKFINPYGRDLIKGFIAGDAKDGSVINPVKEMSVINPDIECNTSILEYYASGALSEASPGTMYFEGGKIKVFDGGYRGCVVEARSAPLEITFKNVNLYVDSINTDALMLFGNYNHKVNLDGVKVELGANATGANVALIKGTVTATAPNYEVICQNITFTGGGTADNNINIVERFDAYVYNGRVVDTGTTGTLNAVVTGTSLAWGATV